MGVLQTIPHDSDKGISGLAYVLLANIGASNLQVTVDASNNTTFTADVSLNTLFTKFVMTKETSNFTVTGTGTPTAGTTSYNHVLTLVFARNEALKANQVKVMGKIELVGIAVDRNGSAWCLGNDENGGLDMTSSTGTSGTGPNDLSGQTIVLSGNQKAPESFVTSTVLATLQA
jgi:hypothetical protein